MCYKDRFKINSLRENLTAPQKPIRQLPSYPDTKGSPALLVKTIRQLPSYPGPKGRSAAQEKTIRQSSGYNDSTIKNLIVQNHPEDE
jgi:hypothetical protein